MGLAALALLCLAAWFSIGDGDGDICHSDLCHPSAGHTRPVSLSFAPLAVAGVGDAAEIQRLLDRADRIRRHHAAAGALEVGPAPGLLAAAEAYGAPEPTEEDYRRVRWALSFFEDAGGYYDEDLLLAIEWCESSRRDRLVGAADEEGRFQFLPSTWDRLTREWMKTRDYPPPVDPFDAYDATLMAAFLLSKGQCHEWTCCR